MDNAQRSHADVVVSQYIKEKEQRRASEPQREEEEKMEPPIGGIVVDGRPL